MLRKEIQRAVKSKKWQLFRQKLKGKSTSAKKSCLKKWLVKNKYSNTSKIQVSNYINALKRGGQY